MLSYNAKDALLQRETCPFALRKGTFRMGLWQVPMFVKDIIARNSRNLFVPCDLRAGFHFFTLSPFHLSISPLESFAYSDGVMPVVFLKAAMKLDTDLKPTLSEMPCTL